MTRFQMYRSSVCLLTWLCLFSSSAVWANAVGTVIFKSGAVQVRHADSSVMEVSKGLSLNAGDTIETQDGRVQFSLVDGGKVSLQPHSVYKIHKYAFSGKEDGSEYAFTELIKGGLRTISGLIGHKNPDRYQLKTAVATIGIRGTEFTVNFNGGNLLMTTNQGSVEVCNSGGCLIADAGMSIAVNGSGQKPKFSHTQATSRANQPNTKSIVAVESAKPVFATADIVGENGFPDVVNDSAESVAHGPSLKGYQGKGMAATLMRTGCACGIDDVYEAGLNLDSTNKPLEIENSNVPTVIRALTFDALNSGSDGVVSWGRATGTFDNGTVDESIEWMDYIVGLKPAPGQLNNLSGTYHVFASTAPMLVDTSGVSAPIGAVNSTTGSLNFDFNTSLYSYNLNVQTVGENYLLSGSGASLDKNNPSFAAAGAVTSVGTTCTIGTCNQALHDASHLVQGAFFGKQGDRAGMQYGFTAPSGAIYGSTVLK